MTYITEGKARLTQYYFSQDFRFELCGSNYREELFLSLYRCGDKPPKIHT